MKTFFAAAIILLTPNIVSAQDTATLQKWRRAVIQLETRTYDTTGYAQFDATQKIYNEMLTSRSRRDPLTVAQVLDSMKKFNNNYNPRVANKPIIAYGTALFLKHNNRRYLITAKHVLNDKSEAGWRVKYGADKKYDSSVVFASIYRVRSYEEIAGGRRSKPQEYVLQLNDNPSKPALPYTFSSDELDLVVWSLDNPYMNLPDTSFANNLEANEYEPIDSNEIMDEPSFVGDNVFTVGFPFTTSFVGTRTDIPQAATRYSSPVVSEPIYSFGKIAMINKSFTYFWTDMSIYPGNSGGPLVDNGKLAGIVIGQARENIEYQNAVLEDYYARSPFGFIIKAKYIKDLIKIQEEKDKAALIELQKSNEY